MRAALASLMAVLGLTVCVRFADRSFLDRLSFGPWGRVVVFSAPAPVAPVSVARGSDNDPAAVVLVVGQSQAGNFARHDFPDTVVALDGDKFASFTRQVPGADGGLQSIWPRVARRYQEQTSSTLQVAVASVGATRLAQWEPGSPGWSLVVNRLQALAALGLSPDLVVLMQGEADAIAGTTRRAWVQQFQSFQSGLQKAGTTASILVVRETRCFSLPPNSEIRHAQEYVSKKLGVGVGPDLDSFDTSFRWDSCHLNTRGVDSVAGELARSIASMLRQRRRGA